MTKRLFLKEITIDDILRLSPRELSGTEIIQEDIENILKASGAYWFNKDPLVTHALLTSGNHSNGYINLSKAYQYVNLVEILADQLAMKVRRVIHRHRKFFGRVERIVSPYSVAHIAQELAKDLEIEKIAYFEKNKSGNLFLKRFEIETGELVLIFDDLTTTGKTIREMWRILKEREAKIFPVVGMIVYRPPPSSAGSFLLISNGNYEERIPIVSLIYKEIAAFDPNKCPWCKKGSVAVRPKENWDRLINQI